jgi:hypothetical protein
MLVLVPFGGYSSPAKAADSVLAGDMTYANYLLGGPWNCTTAVPAMMGHSAHAEHVTLTFDVVPGNVLHDHVSASDYSGDDYFGYNPKTNTYWIASADSAGNNESATSADAKTYTGTSSMGGMSTNVTSTYAKVSASSVTFHEVVSGGGQQEIFDSTCTR